MNHDQLLSQIMQKRATVYEDDVAVDLANILYTVAELHKPYKYDGAFANEIGELKCWSEHVKYPCRTIQLLKERLPNV